jgi:hypothetical protein
MALDTNGGVGGGGVGGGGVGGGGVGAAARRPCVTILGSCRQDSLFREFDVTRIGKEVSYTHSTKEMREVARFCREAHLDAGDAARTFRSPMLGTALPRADVLAAEFVRTNVFVCEVASRRAYELDGAHVHHIALDDPLYWIQDSWRARIRPYILEDDDIVADLAALRHELGVGSGARHMVVVSHIVTRPTGARHDLAVLLERACAFLGIPFLNPARELAARGIDVARLIEVETLPGTDVRVANHYTDCGHDAMACVYRDFIGRLYI